ncbi:hypothetical protein RND71_028053 [Anisodus tanguticus]|uniref:Uncharacterized protein n=1 Tax=Anisodus tanguticus TaxID=243964 RepID=A0AAE1RHU1_9SOLA|nr:hypothetical protein RND71_028053 [Anisodus tanguticus]
MFTIVSLPNPDWILEAISLFPQQTTLYKLSKTPQVNVGPDEIDMNCDDPFGCSPPLQQVA